MHGKKMSFRYVIYFYIYKLSQIVSNFPNCPNCPYFPGLKSFHETILLSACYQLFKSTLHTVEVKRSKVFKKY